MSILDTDRTLPSNRLIFEVRRDAAKRERLHRDLERLMRDQGLSEEERRAFRDCVGSNNRVGHEGTLATVRYNFGTVMQSAALVDRILETER